jgi:hypothetical protein
MTQLAHIAARRTGFRSRRQGLFLSAALGIALGLAPATRAEAQTSGGFQGTPAFDPSKVDIVRGPNTDTITLKAPVATINWTPTDNQGTGPINFLPQGNTGIFQNDPNSVSNFAVLNRIVPADTTRRVDFNGRVISQLRDAAGNITGPGGSVAFYSPGGIFISSTAVFDIGSLLLTSLDPLTDGSGNFFGPSGNFSLRGADGSTAVVVTAAGSQINALANGSYVGLIAPRLEHGGAIRVNGSVGLIAADSLDLTIADGLFNIVVNTGTSVANAITSNGSIGGPASTGGSDNHIIYAVAVPKNQAVTTLLGGTVGFDAATSATVENGEIILSAGYNVAGRNIVVVGPAEVPANIVIAGGTFTSDVRGRAVTDFFIADQQQNTTFQQDITAIGGARAHIGARNGRTITVGGNATVSNGRGDLFDGEAATGGQALMYAEAGSTLEVAGSATIDAETRGRLGEAATGGEAGLNAVGGTVRIMGDVVVEAGGLAGGTLEGQDGPGATGGQANIFANGSGSITIGGRASVMAGGLAGVDQGSTAGAPGTGQGGTASINADGATIAIARSATVFANGSGGFSQGGDVAGNGVGGVATALAQNGGRLSFGTGSNVSAEGRGGTSTGVGNTLGGNGTGGRAQVFTLTTGTITATGSLTISAEGEGGNGIGAGNGGNGTGGLADLFTNAGELNFECQRCWRCRRCWGRRHRRRGRHRREQHQWCLRISPGGPAHWHKPVPDQLRDRRCRHDR